MAKETTEEKKPGRFAEIRQGYRAIKQLDGKIGWFMLLAGLATFAVIVGIGFLLGGLWRWYLVLIAIPDSSPGRRRSANGSRTLATGDWPTR